MSATVHLEKDFKTVRLCLTGRVITMYRNSDGSAVAHYAFDDEMKAGKRFIWQCELLEKGNRGADNGRGKLCRDQGERIPFCSTEQEL